MHIAGFDMDYRIALQFWVVIEVPVGTYRFKVKEAVFHIR